MKLNPHSRQIPGKSNAAAMMRALMAGIFLIGAAIANAGVPWWAGTARDAQQSASQNGKDLVLYFETEAADDCVKMNKETWPAFTDAKLIDRAVWIRLNPKQHEKFFSYYDVFITPEIVILDSETKEKGRIRGFIEPKMLGDLLTAIDMDAPKDEKKAAKVFDARGMDVTGISLEDFQQAQKSRKENEAMKYFFFESFDKYKTLEDLDPLVYNIYINGLKGIHIEPTGGVYSSQGLLVSAIVTTKVQWESHPAAAMRIDISRGLDKVDLIEGVLKVVMYVRARKMPKDDSEFAAISIVPRGTEPPVIKDIKKPGAIYYAHTLSGAQTVWVPVEITTESFNFKQNKAFLSLWVDNFGQGFYVDDLRVELLQEGAVAAGKTTAGAAMPNPIEALAVTVPGRQIDPVFQALDKNHDSRLSQKEIGASEVKSVRFVKGDPGWTFEKQDKNGDGYISLEEWAVKN